MFDPAEVQRCEEALRQLSPVYDWLLSAPDVVRVNDIVKGYHVAPETVTKWCEQHLVPGAIQDPATKLWRIHRVGLVLFFGRQVLASFLAA